MAGASGEIGIPRRPCAPSPRLRPALHRDRQHRRAARRDRARRSTRPSPPAGFPRRGVARRGGPRAGARRVGAGRPAPPATRGHRAGPPALRAGAHRRRVRGDGCRTRAPRGIRRRGHRRARRHDANIAVGVAPWGPFAVAAAPGADLADDATWWPSAPTRRSPTRRPCAGRCSWWARTTHRHAVVAVAAIDALRAVRDDVVSSTWAGRPPTAPTPTSRPSARPASSAQALIAPRPEAHGLVTADARDEARHRHRRHQDRCAWRSAPTASSCDQVRLADRLRRRGRSSRRPLRTVRAHGGARRGRTPSSIRVDRHRHPRHRRRRHRARRRMRSTSGSRDSTSGRASPTGSASRCASRTTSTPRRVGAHHLLGIADGIRAHRWPTSTSARASRPASCSTAGCWRGAHGVAGEIGHIPVDPAGPCARCGQRGCLETLASGSAIARDVADRRPAARAGAVRRRGGRATTARSRSGSGSSRASRRRCACSCSRPTSTTW